jgi:hypothetical protein
LGFLFLNLQSARAQNPFITDLFTADPSARVFDGKLYVYPSHDVPCEKGQGFIGFCMADYHVYSTENLTDWQDHGVIVDQNHVPWVDPSKYTMWAPDCISRNGKYYFYFPSISRDSTNRRRIGVAIADKPYGPFKPEPTYIQDVQGIDPNVFIDKDGQSYLYWGSGDTLRMAKLKENMLELASKPQAVLALPAKFKEGPYLFERNGIYYFTFPHVANRIERLAYASGNNPMGPFEYKGVIMDESPTNCWTNHHSILEFKGQWYLFYHHNDLSPSFDKNRSIRMDSLFFNSDGTIKKVIPTLRGVGLTQAEKNIQIDRYSDISKEGAAISFLDPSNRHAGWKVTFTKPEAWVCYNAVDMNTGKFKNFSINAFSETGGKIDVRLDNSHGPVLASIEIPKGKTLNVTQVKVKKIPAGIHTLYVTNANEGEVHVDWVSFK